MDFAFTAIGLRRGDPNALIGDGPPKRARTRARARSACAEVRARRAATPLAVPYVGEETAALRRKAEIAFHADLLDEERISEDEFYALDGDAGAKLLIEYGQRLYDAGRSVSDLKQTVIAVSRRVRAWRGALDRAWEAVRKWEILEPSTPHIPIPVTLFRAMLEVGCRTESFGFVVALLLMFVGCIRPGEALSAVRKEVVLPVGGRRLLVLAIFKHKSVTRGRMRGAHHVLFDEPAVVRLLEARCLTLAPDQTLVGLKAHAFRRAFDRVLRALHCAHVGLTPACLRAGGATERYLQRESIADISWRLRHADLSTTRHYVLAATAMLTVAQLAAGTQEEVFKHSRRAPRALRELVSLMTASEPR